MTRVEVNPGVCGFKATIIAKADDKGKIRIEIESECTYVQELADQLGELDPFEEWKSFYESTVFKSANTCINHTDCVIPTAILKAVNVEAGLALPADVTLEISREDRA